MWKWLKGFFGPPPIEERTEDNLWEDIQKGICPACKVRDKGFMSGPCGGMAQNIFCAVCGQGFNVMTPFGTVEIIHKDERYIQK